MDMAKPKIKCTVPGCNNWHLCHGYCIPHYVMMRDHGCTNYVRPTDKDRFFNSFTKKGDDDCWEMNKGIESAGYGRIKIKGKWIKAHRYSWELFNGPIPNGLLICHHCDNHRCVNPKHLFLGTPKDNIQDMVKKGRWNGNKLGNPFNKRNPITGRFVKG